MIAKIIPKKNYHGTANGIAIQRHLEKIYDDLKIQRSIIGSK